MSSSMEKLLPLLPSIDEIARTLYTCTKRRKLSKLFRMHAYMCESGLDCMTSLGNLLITRLVDLGAVHYAQKIFDRIEYPDEHSWNALIVGYATCDEPSNALTFYQKMHESDLRHLTSGSLVLLLKSCTILRAIEKGCNIHAEIARGGRSEADVFVGSALVDMYVKCGFMSRSQEVFNKLVFRDVVSWTALIAGYAEQGHCDEVFNCAKQMQQEGIAPNSFTMVCMVKASGIVRAMEKGQEVHNEIAKVGLEGELLIGNSLIDMYAKCGYLAGAHAVFQGLSARDVVSWTSLIVGYSDCGQFMEAIDCYDQMQHVGYSPNTVTLMCTLKACGNLEAPDKGLQVHREIVLKGFENDNHIANTVMDMYFKCGLIGSVEAVFDKLPVQDLVSLNVLLAGYLEKCSGKEALMRFQHMQHNGFAADLASSVSIVKACTKSGDISTGKEVHSCILKSGFDQDLPVANSLIDMYGKFGLLAEAEDVFDCLPIRSLVSWNALLAAYAEHMPGDEAVLVFEQMQEDGMCPDAVTCVCGLKLFGTMGSIAKGQDIHIGVVKLGMEGESLIGNSLVSMYAKCGWVAEAQEVFDKLLSRDVVSWSALMAGYAQLGESKSVLVFLDRMISEGIKPNLITMTCVLNACSDEGLLHIGQVCFDALNINSPLVPTIEHFTCMIDLLSRAGLLEKATQLILEMPMNPDIVVWLNVLGACRKWGNVELGRVAFENAAHLDRKSEAAYVIMYNIYVEAGMYNEACMVDIRRAQNQV